MFNVLLFKRLEMKTCILSMILILFAGRIEPASASDQARAKSFKWELINEEAAWDARAGLQVVYLNNSFYLMGGRTPIDPQIVPVPGASTLWADVWQSKDMGESWQKILDSDINGHWAPRAYFQAVTKEKYMYVIGGQDFNIINNPDPGGPPLIPVSQFFNDVWRSRDGMSWEQMTPDAGWDGRAGLSCVVFKGEIYVLGGSKNDDSSIIGPEGPQRIYFNDVWKSRDGKSWQLLTENAGWAPRAGGIAAVKNGYLYMIGGEAGFVGFPPPYFNDVWRSRNGRDWELVTANADWIARPGHQCLVAQDQFILFGGFGFPNPMDMWTSKDGADWELLDAKPWNAFSPEEIKYDFDAVAVPQQYGHQPVIYTFGGDRETFDFTDPANYLRVDNDVWRFTASFKNGIASDQTKQTKSLELKNHPNPFNPTTTISFNLANAAHVILRVFSITGEHVTTLVNDFKDAGPHYVVWNGKNAAGNTVASGMYVYQLNFDDNIMTNTMNFIK